MKFLFLFLLVLLLYPEAEAQYVQIDSVTKKEMVAEPKPVKRHSPKKAALLSAALPGLGQVYNKKYWKIPIIYAGFAGLGYAIGFNAKKWKTYSNAYRLRIDGDTATVDEFEGQYNESNLVTLKNFYRRNMDLSVIFTTVFYLMNIVDAAVDAHLFDYDISDDLSLRIDPMINLNEQGNYTAGLKFTLQL